ncbi:hypothetical protein BDY19DRAFT_105228 [Irpex rosettiformis]|uniref:Uncharacterized protein n=1 Tax=Irpex rosettiformis TaxID=378272 RepID=A0ACB8U5K2_9APHY|nr:hypothetical protein BDY19DRAFT_105228 [Irpex rosettiformis]
MDNTLFLASEATVEGPATRSDVREVNTPISVSRDNIDTLSGWTVVSEAMTRYDEQTIADWKDDLANLLIFNLSLVYSQVSLLALPLSHKHGYNRVTPPPPYRSSCSPRYPPNWPRSQSLPGLSIQLLRLHYHLKSTLIRRLCQRPTSVSTRYGSLV